MSTRIFKIKKNILNANDSLAQNLRNLFSRKNIRVINFVSSPGSGKTELVTVLATTLIKKGLHVCIIVGDLATDNDAVRLRRSGADTCQINTHGNCHLDATMVKKSLKALDWTRADILLIENVGNLVCPASYDLGEHMRVVLMSVTEGEDKPSKYPTIFNSSDICVLSKIDLAAAACFDEKRAVQNIKNISPDIKIIKTSAKKGTGINNLIHALVHERKTVF